jgi:hypothetical protein
MDNIIIGFEWYLPLAFKDCIAQCKFEQGDVIYRHRPKGTIWSEEIKHIDFLVQVKSPARSNSSAVGDLDVFSSNWNSKIIFEKIYPNDHSKNKTIETTQGKFFSFLWTNDEAVLTSDTLTLPVLTNIPAKQINSDFIKSKIPTNWCGFAIVIDSVSNLIISKRNAINDALAQKYTLNVELFDLKEAVILKTIDTTSYSGISPTLGVELFLIQSDNVEEVQEVLKNVLFKGVKNRFNINTHGQLFKN